MPPLFMIVSGPPRTSESENSAASLSTTLSLPRNLSPAQHSCQARASVHRLLTRISSFLTGHSALGVAVEVVAGTGTASRDQSGG